MGVKSNDLDFSSFDEAASSQQPKELVYDISVFDNAVKKKDPLGIFSPTSQGGESSSTTSTNLDEYNALGDEMDYLDKQYNNLLKRRSMLNDQINARTNTKKNSAEFNEYNSLVKEFNYVGEQLNESSNKYNDLQKRRSSMQTSVEQPNVISLILKKRKLKKDALDLGDIVVSGGIGGAGVYQLPVYDKINEANNVNEEIRKIDPDMKDSDIDKIEEELENYPGDVVTSNWKNPDLTPDLSFRESTLDRLRRQNYPRYLTWLNTAKIYNALKNVDKELAKKWSILNSKGNDNLDNFGHFNTLKNIKDGQDEIISKIPNFTDDQKKKLLEYNNQIYSSLAENSINDDEKAREYIAKRLASVSAELDVVPTASNSFSNKKLYEGEDIDNFPIQSIEKFVDTSNAGDVRAFELYKYNRSFKDAVQKSPNIEEAAINYVSTLDPKIAEQREKLKDDGRDLPEELKAEYVKAFLDDPRSQKLASTDPQFKILYTQAKNGFEINYPKYAVKRIAETISQYREDKRMNNVIINIPTESGTREIVDELVKQGKLSERDKLMYYKDIDPNVGVGKSILRGTVGIPFGAFTGVSPIKTPGLVENALTSFQNTTKDMARTVEDIPLISFAMPSEAYRLQAALTDNARSLKVNLTKAHEISEGTGHLVGFTVPMIFGGEGIKALGATEKAAHLINTALMFEGQNKDQALILFPNDPVKRLTFTALSTAGDMFLTELIPTKSIRNGISNVLKKDIADITTKLLNKEITPQIASKTLMEKTISYLPKLAIENAKTAGTLTGFGVYHKALESLFGASDLSAADIAYQSVPEFKHNFLITPVLAMLALKGKTENRKVDSRVLMEMASMPDAYKQKILDYAEKNNEPKEVTEEKLRNLDNATAIFNDVNKANLTPPQKEKFFIYSLAEKSLKDEASKTTDSSLKKKYLEQAEGFNSIKDNILSGEDKALEFYQFESTTKDEQQDIDAESANAVKRSMGEDAEVPEEQRTEEGVQGGVGEVGQGVAERTPAVLEGGEKIDQRLKDATNEEPKPAIETTKLYELDENGEYKPSLGGDSVVEKMDEQEKESNSIKIGSPAYEEAKKLDPAKYKLSGSGSIPSESSARNFTKEVNGKTYKFNVYEYPDGTSRYTINEMGKAEGGMTLEPIRDVSISELTGEKVPEIQKAEVKPAELPEPETTANAPKTYTEDNLDQISTEGLNKVQAKVVNSIRNTVKAVSSLVKGTGKTLSVTVHTSPESYTKAVIEAGGTRQDSNTKGFYLSKDGSIHINLEKASSETTAHEVFHPVLDFLEVNKPEVIDTIYNQLNSFTEGQSFVESNKRRYTGETTQKKEAITDFIAHVADGSVVINPSNFAKIKKFVIDTLNKIGFDIKSFRIAEIKDAKELVDLAKLISEKFKTGEEITKENLKIYNDKAKTAETSDGIDGKFKVRDIKGNSGRGIQLSKLSDETLKNVKGSIRRITDIGDLDISRTLFYDNTKVGNLSVKNRITGYTPKVVGKGGFFFSYMPEAIRNKAVLAFTSINQAIQTLKRQRKYPESAQAIAAQNFMTAHLGNKSTLEALFGKKGSKVLGIFQESVKGNPEGEAELLKALIDSTYSVANQVVQSGVNAGKPTASSLEIKKMIDRNGGTLDNIKSLNEFRDNVLTFKGGDSFGARNILFTEILQEKPTKVTKSTRDSHVIMHYKYGIPTLTEIAEGNNQKELNNAQTGDVIKLVRPFPDPIVYTTSKELYDQYTNNPTPEMVDNGIKIELLPEEINHESYPFILRGENIGVLDNYISATQLYEGHEKIKNVPKKQSFYSVGRMPAEAEPGKYPAEPKSEGTPQWSRAEEGEGKGKTKKEIYREKLDDKDINSIRASLRRKAPDSYILDTLDALQDAKKNPDELIYDDVVAQLYEDGITLGGIKNALLQDGIFETGKEVDNYFIQMGGKESMGIFKRLAGAKSDIQFSREEEEGGLQFSKAEEGEPEPKRVGLSKAEISKQVEDFSMLPPARVEKISDVELDKMADDAIASGYDVGKLVARLRADYGDWEYNPKNKSWEKKNGDVPRVPANDLEITILNKYAAALNAEQTKNPSRETLQKYTETMEAARRALSITGATLRQARRSQALVDNLSNFLVDKEVSQGAPLTDNQLKVETEKYNELQKAKEEVEAQLKIKTEENIKLKAELEKKKAGNKAGAKKSETEYKSERKSLLDAAKEALLKLKGKTKEGGTGAGVEFSKEDTGRKAPTTTLMALAPIVRDMMKLHLSQGVQKLEDLVNVIHSDLSGLDAELTGDITKSQLIEVIAGRHDAPPVKTRNELAAKARLMKRESELILALADARKGLEKAKKEKDDAGEIKNNRRIKELEDAIEEVKRINKESREIDEDIDSQEISEDERLAKKQKQLLKRIEQLQSDLENKRYLDVQEELPPLKLDAKTKALMDRYITLQNKIKEERLKDRLAKESTGARIWRKAMQVLDIKRRMQTAFDISVSLRQGVTILKPGTSKIWGKSFVAQLKSMFSTPEYNTLMYTIRHSEDYHEMIEDGIVFNDVENPNEDYMNANFIMNVPIVGGGLKMSERAANGFLNTARYELYMKFKKNLESQGITRQSDPKAYKDAAKWAMNMTGRGNLLKSFEHSDAQTLLGNTFYGARLMASRFNMLNPYAYYKMHPAARKQAMIDMASWVGTQIAVAYSLSKIPGVSVSTNPDDSDFMQVRYKNKVYDLTGGMATYARTFLRLTEAGLAKLDEPGYIAKEKGKKAGESTIKFFRNKLAPNTSMAFDYFFNSTSGKDFDPKDALRAYPMYVDDVVDAWKDQGVTSLATVLLPNIIGIGFGSYARKGELEPDVNKLTERSMNNTINMDYSNIKNYKKGGSPITDKEFLQYAEKVDTKTNQYINELYSGGKYIVDNNNQIVHKPYSELTADQVNRAIQTHKKSIQDQVQNEMFGEPTGTQYVAGKIKDLKERQLREVEKEGYKNMKNFTTDSEGVPVTKEEYLKYTKNISRLLAQDINNLAANGTDIVDEDGDIVHKEFNDLTNDELDTIISQYSNDIQKYVSTELFGRDYSMATIQKKIGKKIQKSINLGDKMNRINEYNISE
jgi:hypothetical protein